MDLRAPLHRASTTPSSQCNDEDGTAPWVALPTNVPSSTLINTNIYERILHHHICRMYTASHLPGNGIRIGIQIYGPPSISSIRPAFLSLGCVTAATTTEEAAASSAGAAAAATTATTVNITRRATIICSSSGRKGPNQESFRASGSSVSLPGL